MKNLFAMVSIFLLCTSLVFAQNCTIGTSAGSTCTFNMDGVLTVPSGVDLLIEVKAWGAGGGSQTAKNKRSGGGGGAYFNQMYSVTGGSTFSITVGQGAISSAGGDTSFDFDGGGIVTVGGGGLGTTTPGLGGTGTGSVSGGDGGARETGGLNSGGGGGGSGPGNGPGGNGGDPIDGIGGIAGGTGSPGAAGGAGGDAMGSTAGIDGGFPGGGAGGKGTDPSIQDGAAGGNGQVIVCVTEVLPVELVHFNAQAKGQHIIIQWQTEREFNNNGFELQKSEDGIDWHVLEFLDGKGTANVLRTYKSIDKSPTQSLNYYRLKQMDFDGKFKYSKVISVVVNRLDDIMTYPNPVNNQLNIEGIAAEEVLIQIYNTIGQVIYQELQFIDAKLEIDVSTLKIGNYFLNITDTNAGSIIHQQLIVKINDK